MCHLQSYSVYNNQPATWVQLITVFFKIKHICESGSFPMNCPSCSPTTQRFLQRIEKKKTTPPRSVPPRSLRSLDLSGFLGEAARGWRSWSTTGNLRNSKFKKSPQKLNLKFEDFGWRLLEDAWSFSMFLEMFEKCFDDGLRCLNMVNDAWCVWSCLGFWWILRFCHRGLWCDENVWRRCVQLFRDGWSCFKTFKMPKRRLKMAENVKSCLRIIQDGLWCFQRYLKMLLKVAWKMVKDS